MENLKSSLTKKTWQQYKRSAMCVCRGWGHCFT